MHSERGGDSIYLPFFADGISSVRLSFPPPAGVDFFYAENLSGYKFFVDRVCITNEVAVYDANTTQHTMGAGET